MTKESESNYEAMIEILASVIRELYSKPHPLAYTETLCRHIRVMKATIASTFGVSEQQAHDDAVAFIAKERLRKPSITL